MNHARLAEAFRYAADKHSVQLRKGTEIPYISHLMSVCGLVLENGGGEGHGCSPLSELRLESLVPG